MFLHVVEIDEYGLPDLLPEKGSRPHWACGRKHKSPLLSSLSTRNAILQNDIQLHTDSSFTCAAAQASSLDAQPTIMQNRDWFNWYEYAHGLPMTSTSSEQNSLKQHYLFPRFCFASMNPRINPPDWLSEDLPRQYTFFWCQNKTIDLYIYIYILGVDPVLGSIQWPKYSKDTNTVNLIRIQLDRENWRGLPKWHLFCRKHGEKGLGERFINSVNQSSIKIKSFAPHSAFDPS